MKRALCSATGAVAILITASSAGGCSSSNDVASTSPTPDAGSTSTLAEPAVPCADAEAAIYGDPGALPPTKGAILRCSKGADISKEAIQARLTGLSYVGQPITSGARVYRVVYRTERGDAAGSPGYTSAIVYVPTTPRAEKLPIVVAARGARGQGAACAVSKADVSADGEKDYARLVLPLVGNGFVVIDPDLPGYANYGAPNNPPSAFAQAGDVGKATLDGSRALKQLFPQLADTTVLVGHSQGGHSALAALALAGTYGAQGPIAGVAVYAPLWLSQRSWGAILDSGVADRYAINDPATSLPNAVSIWYHYTQAELLDGPGEGKKLFLAAKQDAIKQFVDSSCIGTYEAPLEALGASYAYELFDPAFVEAVGTKASFGADCGSDAVCAKWIGRYSADRPHLTGIAAKTPILMMYGGKDATIPEDRMRCALDRLRSDGVNLTVCVEPNATHGSILDARSEHVTRWIASLTIAGAPSDMPACPADASAIAKSCATPPPND